MKLSQCWFKVSKDEYNLYTHNIQVEYNKEKVTFLKTRKEKDIDIHDYECLYLYVTA